jgi:hypothetical protein
VPGIERQIKTSVRKRLKAIKTAALKLQVLLTKDPPGRGLTSVTLEAAYVVGSEINFDLLGLSENLERLENYKGQGGRPASEAWLNLMSQLAKMYKDETGEDATVTENEHGAGSGERYSGRFVRLAALVDQATAEISGLEPRPNSALGPALRRLLEPRSKRRRSKTP